MAQKPKSRAAKGAARKEKPKAKLPEKKPISKSPNSTKTIANKTIAKPAGRIEKPAVKPAAKASNGHGSTGDKQRFTLHGSNLSGPTYTVALMLSLSRYPYSYIHVNLREGQHKQPDYLVKNRYGQVPALRDGQQFFVQSAAILEHLAEQLAKFDGKTQPERNRIREWLFWQWDKLAVPMFRLRAKARGIRQFGDEIRVMYDTESRAALAVLEQEFTRSEWVAGKKPTIADIGIYGVVRYAHEALVDLTPYPHVLAWKARIEALPGFGTPEQLLPLESRLL